MKTFNKIYTLVTTIPRGKVSTYGAISKKIGINPRVVGFALHANKDSQNIPCHRVINSKGKISSGYAFGGANMQQKILQQEGIKFDKNGAVDLKTFGYFLF